MQAPLLWHLSRLILDRKRTGSRRSWRVRSGWVWATNHPVLSEMYPYLRPPAPLLLRGGILYMPIIEILEARLNNRGNRQSARGCFEFDILPWKLAPFSWFARHGFSSARHKLYVLSTARSCTQGIMLSFSLAERPTQVRLTSQSTRRLVVHWIMVCCKLEDTLYFRERNSCNVE